MTYSYDRSVTAASVRPAVKDAAKLKAQAIKVLRTYAKADSVWRECIAAAEGLRPSFNSFSGEGEIEKLLSGFVREARQLQDVARSVTNRASALFDTSKEIEDKVKEHPMGRPLK